MLFETAVGAPQIAALMYARVAVIEIIKAHTVTAVRADGVEEFGETDVRDRQAIDAEGAQSDAVRGAFIVRAVVAPHLQRASRYRYHVGCACGSTGEACGDEECCRESCLHDGAC